LNGSYLTKPSICPLVDSRVVWGEQGVGVSRREHAHTVLARMHAQPQENMCRLTHSTFHGWQRNPALQGHGREDLRGQGAGAILSKLTFPNTPCGVLVCCLSLTSGPLSPRGPILAVVFVNLIKQASPLLSLSLTHCLSLSHTLSPSPFLSLSHTHTHSLSLSLFLLIRTNPHAGPLQRRGRRRQARQARRWYAL